jgi:hypothetical protein
LTACRFDLAVVQLSDKRIGYNVGWLGLSWSKQGFNGTIYSVGYPGTAQPYVYDVPQDCCNTVCAADI